MRRSTRRVQTKKSNNYKYLVIVVIIFAALQFWILKSFYKEEIIKIPLDLFEANKQYPLTELVINKSTEDIPDEAQILEPVPGTKDIVPEEIANENLTEDATYSNEIENDLSEDQKNIVLRTLEILEENVKYEYELYPETGYPTENVGVSTDIIAIVLRDCGYDLMELIYDDMLNHSDSYPMDIIGRDEPIKYIDFRHVFFQETFFKRHALELETSYDKNHADNNIQWQPGDIVYFQLDEENPHKDLGGFISPNTNQEGVPLVIMTSEELGKASEVDVLLDYKIVGHYRYPYPEEMQ